MSPIVLGAHAAKVCSQLKISVFHYSWQIFQISKPGLNPYSYKYCEAVTNYCSSKFLLAHITHHYENTSSTFMHHVLYYLESYSLLLTTFKNLVANLSVGFLVPCWPIIIPSDPIVKTFYKVSASAWNNEELLHNRTWICFGSWYMMRKEDKKP